MLIPLLLFFRFYFFIFPNESRDDYDQEDIVSNEAPRLQRFIVGGKPVDPPFVYPWVASLQQNGEHFCGGSMITSNWLVTAAHCSGRDIKMEQLIVHARRFNLSSDTEDGFQFTVIQRYVHPGYNSKTLFNDIALWKLNGTLFPLPVTIDNSFVKVDAFIAAGWGVTDEKNDDISQVLQSVSLPMVGYKQCAKIYGKNALNSDSQICAGGVQGHDSCYGDSGGPLFQVIDDKPVLIGLTSYGYGCGRKGYPGVYTKVAYFRGWILETIKRDLDGLYEKRIKKNRKLSAVDEKLSAVDEKLSAVDEKLSAVDEKYRKLSVDEKNRKLSAVDQKLSAIDQKLSAIDQKYRKLSAMDDSLSIQKLGKVVREFRRMIDKK